MGLLKKTLRLVAQMSNEAIGRGLLCLLIASHLFTFYFLLTERENNLWQGQFSGEPMSQTEEQCME